MSTMQYNYASVRARVTGSLIASLHALCTDHMSLYVYMLRSIDHLTHRWQPTVKIMNCRNHVTAPTAATYVKQEPATFVACGVSLLCGRTTP